MMIPAVAVVVAVAAVFLVVGVLRSNQCVIFRVLEGDDDDDDSVVTADRLSRWWLLLAMCSPTIAR